MLTAYCELVFEIIYYIHYNSSSTILVLPSVWSHLQLSFLGLFTFVSYYLIMIKITNH